MGKINNYFDIPIKYGLGNRWIGNIIFAGVFLLLFYLFGLHKTIFYPPQSVHIWRQTNCLSLIQNYYENNVPFFKPEMHNQFPNDGYSGKSVGEFPIIYYTVAQLWKVFGKHEWIFKLVQIVILFFGLFSLFLGLREFLKSQFLSGFISLTVFTSPMVVFYGPNFLPDVPSLAFIFMAWLFIVRFLDQRKTFNLWIAAFLFCLAILLKVTSAISFIALGGWILFELMYRRKNERIFDFKFKHFIPFLLSLFIAVCWYLYVDYYNEINKGHFSFHGTWPVWEMTNDQFYRVIDSLDKIYFKELFLPATQYITLGVWVFLIVNIRKLDSISKYIIVILPIGFLIQVLLWFQVLEGHDYYMINLLVVFVLIWAVFVTHLNKIKAKYKYLIFLAALGLFSVNAIKCQKLVELRYIGWMNDDYNLRLKSLLEIESVFQNLGIGKEDKVISINDPSINSSLYFMNRKGYTQFGSDLTDPEVLYHRIDQGAKYLVVTDSTITSKVYLKPFLQKKIGRYENVHIYDLQKLRK